MTMTVRCALLATPVLVHARSEPSYNIDDLVESTDNGSTLENESVDQRKWRDPNDNRDFRGLGEDLQSETSDGFSVLNNTRPSSVFSSDPSAYIPNMVTSRPAPQPTPNDATNTHDSQSAEFVTQRVADTRLNESNESSSVLLEGSNNDLSRVTINNYVQKKWRDPKDNRDFRGLGEDLQSGTSDGFSALKNVKADSVLSSEPSSYIPKMVTNRPAPEASHMSGVSVHEAKSTQSNISSKAKDQPQTVENTVGRASKGSIEWSHSVDATQSSDRQNASNTSMKNHANQPTDIASVVPNSQVRQKGQYRILQTLGQGTFGIVYKGLNKDGEIFAIKVLKRVQIFDQRLLEEARKEFELLKPLNHKNVVRCFEVFDHEGEFCTVFEFANHGDLKQHLTERNGVKFTPSEILEWFTQIVHGTAFLHDHKIMHRDLKPANIVLHKTHGDQLEFKIADFGLAREMDGSQQSASTFCGTRVYMSPEMMDHQRYSFQNDIWALGCILYEMCELKRAFAVESDVLYHRIPVLPKKFCAELNAVCSEILVVDATLRPRASALLTRMLTIGTKRKLLDLPSDIKVLEEKLKEHTSNPNHSVSTKHVLEEKLKTLKATNKRLNQINSKGTVKSLFPSFKKDTPIDYVEWFQMIKDEDATLVKAFLNLENMNVNAKDENGHTGLHWACLFDRLDIVQVLLKRSDLDISAVGLDDSTALVLAQKNGHKEIVDVLQKHMVSLESLDISTMSNSMPREESSKTKTRPSKSRHNEKKKHKEVAKTSSSANQKGVKAINYRSPTEDVPFKRDLFYAAQQGDLSTVQSILQHPQVDVNMRNEYHATPLFMACQFGHLPVVREFLKQENIDVNAQKDGGSSPLYITAQQGHVEVMHLLLARDDIHVNSCKDGGDTALMIAIKRGNFLMTEEFLSHKNIQVNHSRQDGATAFYLACYYGHLSIVTQLFEHPGTDGNVVTNAGKNALHIASQKGFPEIVQYLVSHVPQLVQVQNSHGQASLKIAEKEFEVATQWLEAESSKQKLSDKLAKRFKNMTKKDVKVQRESYKKIVAILKNAQ